MGLRIRAESPVLERAWLSRHREAGPSSLYSALEVALPPILSDHIDDCCSAQLPRGSMRFMHACQKVPR